MLELLPDIARIIISGKASGPAKRRRVAALGQHPGREHGHVPRRNRVKPEADRDLTELHAPIVPHDRGQRETLRPWPTFPGSGHTPMGYSLLTDRRDARVRAGSSASPATQIALFGRSTDRRFRNQVADQIGGSRVSTC